MTASAIATMTLASHVNAYELTRFLTKEMDQFVQAKYSKPIVIEQTELLEYQALKGRAFKVRSSDCEETYFLCARTEWEKGKHLLPDAEVTYITRSPPCLVPVVFLFHNPS